MSTQRLTGMPRCSNWRSNSRWAAHQRSSISLSRWAGSLEGAARSALTRTTVQIQIAGIGLDPQPDVVIALVRSLDVRHAAFNRQDSKAGFHLVAQFRQGFADHLLRVVACATQPGQAKAQPCSHSPIRHPGSKREQ